MLILDQLVAQKLVLYTYVARHAPRWIKLHAAEEMSIVEEERVAN